MAEEKRIKLEVSGYVQDVSPIKISKTNSTYFVGVVQTQRDSFDRMVCFDKTKHSILVEAAKTKTPLKFQDIKLSPSKFDVTKRDVMVNQRSVLQSCRKLEFGFQKHDLIDQEESGKTVKSLQEVEIVPEYNKVAVEVKVLSLLDECVQIVREKPLRKQEVTVADSSSSMTLTLWDSHVNNLQVNKSYHVTNLSTRLFQNVKCLSTTPTTRIHQVPDLEGCVQSQNQTNEVEKTGAVTQVGLQQTLNCAQCKTKVDLIENDSPFTRCTGCKMKMRKDLMQKNIHGTLIFQPSDASERLKLLSAFSSPILTFATVNNLDQNIEDLEDFLLTHEVKITYSTASKVLSKLALVHHSSTTTNTSTPPLWASSTPAHSLTQPNPEHASSTLSQTTTYDDTQALPSFLHVPGTTSMETIWGKPAADD